MTVLCYPSCSTCKKALRFLDEHGISYQWRHIADARPSADELRAWWKSSGLPLKRFFNTSGQKYRALFLREKLPLMDEDEQIELLATDGMLVKRPLVVDGARVLVGFRPAEWELFFNL